MIGLRLKKFFHFVLVLFFAFTFSPDSFCYGQKGVQTDAAATVELPKLNINNSFYSQYIWRGYELSHESFVMFPSVTVSYKGFSINWWGDVDTDFKGTPDGLQCMEQDYTASYSNSWKKLNYTLGYIYYNLKGLENTQELFASVGVDMLLSPTLSVYRDIENGKSWYYNLALSHSFPICGDYVGWKHDLSFDVGGWVSYYWMDGYTRDNIEYSAWHDGNVWAGLKVPLSEACSITPKVQYSFPLSHKADENIQAVSFDGNDSQFVYGGLILDYTF